MSDKEKESAGRVVLSVVMTDDRKHVVGFTSDAPLTLVFLALAASVAKPDEKEAPVDFAVKLLSEVAPELATCQHPECAAAREALGIKDAPVRRGTMDPALRARAECPHVIKPDAGEVGAMLSILSEKIATNKPGDKI